MSNLLFVKLGFHQYGAVTAADAEELVSLQVLQQQPLERLLINGKSRP